MRNFNHCRIMTLHLIWIIQLMSNCLGCMTKGCHDEVHHILKGLTGRQKEIIYLRFYP